MTMKREPQKDQQTAKRDTPGDEYIWVQPLEPRLDRNHRVRVRVKDIRLAFHKPVATFDNYVVGALAEDKRLVPGFIYIKTNAAKLYLHPATSLVQLERDLPKSCRRVSGSVLCHRDSVLWTRKWTDDKGRHFLLGLGHSDDEDAPDYEAIYVKPRFSASVEEWLLLGGTM